LYFYLTRDQAVEKVTLEFTWMGFGLDAPINNAFITQPGLIKVKIWRQVQRFVRQFFKTFASN
jgi:hypothetical protein